MAQALLAAVLLAAAAQAQPLAPRPQPDVIYGSDDRLDLYAVKDSRVLVLAASTVGLFQASSVSVADGKARLATQHYGRSYNLCREEPFYDQPSGAFCSGSLVAPDLVMTAGHCVTSQEECADMRFVFGFGIPTAGSDPTSVPASEVYGCARLIGRQQQDYGADWALVRLDRPVSGHAPLKLHRGGSVANGELLFVIGHPAGLPTKVAGGAKVRDASPSGFFVANLDTYGGNSGSAVFNARTGLVEGVLIRGEQDYVDKGNCRVSKACPNEGCRGEDVTKIDSVGWPAEGSAAPAYARIATLAPGLAALLDGQAQVLSRQ